MGVFFVLAGLFGAMAMTESAEMPTEAAAVVATSEVSAPDVKQVDAELDDPLITDKWGDDHKNN